MSSLSVYTENETKIHSKWPTTLSFATMRSYNRHSTGPVEVNQYQAHVQTKHVLYEIISFSMEKMPIYTKFYQLYSFIVYECKLDSMPPLHTNLFIFTKYKQVSNYKHL